MLNRIIHAVLLSRTFVELAARTSRPIRAGACLVLSLAASSWLGVHGQQFTLVSANIDAGASCQHGAITPLISEDGRYVVYSSRCPNLMPNLTINRWQTFRHDLQTGRTELVSANLDNTDSSDGDSSPEDISADGRFVLFASNAQDLTATNYDPSAYFVRDMIERTTTRVPGAADSCSANSPSISADGSVVVFSTLLLGVCDYEQVAAWNRVTGKVTQVSRARGGSQLRSRAYNAVVNATGRFVFFMSTAPYLVPEDNNGQPDIFVRDLETGTLALVSVNYLGSASGNLGAYFVEHNVFTSNRQAITPDGRYIVFNSHSTDLIPQPSVTDSKVFVRDLLTGTTSVVPLSGIPGAFGTYDDYARISSDGRTIAYRSRQRLTASHNAAPEVLVFDRQSGLTRRVSHKPPPTSPIFANPPGYRPIGVSADGRVVSYALLTNMYSGYFGVYLRDLHSGGLTTLFEALELSASFNSAMFALNGTVAFSTADRLAPSDQNGRSDIYGYQPVSGESTPSLFRELAAEAADRGN